MAYHSRLGYHYTSVDAYCADETRNNHIRFLFKGGAADDLRRALRARFIGGVLERIGFAVEVQGDLVNARFHRRPRPEVESRLDLLGRLMGCSRQRDMVMKNESIVNWHVEAFLRGNYSFTPED
jgi:pyruvate,water dikinase